MKDKRAMLRVKIKSLAEEAKIIRFEEARTKGEIRDQLHRHRVIDVRMAARNSHIAYTLIRGKEYSTIEKNPKTPPNWSEVKRMCTKYGPIGFKHPLLEEIK